MVKVKAVLRQIDKRAFLDICGKREILGIVALADPVALQLGGGSIIAWRW